MQGEPKEPERMERWGAERSEWRSEGGRRSRVGRGFLPFGALPGPGAKAPVVSTLARPPSALTTPPVATPPASSFPAYQKEGVLPGRSAPRALCKPLP